MKSEKYLKLREYYELGLWDERKLKGAVSHGWISEEEYEEILSEVK